LGDCLISLGELTQLVIAQWLRDGLGRDLLIAITRTPHQTKNEQSES
jgi:hypothetical protein